VMAQSSVQVNGIDFAYLEAGPADGPLALCLHGFPDHAHTFSELLPALAGQGWHAVAPWMRGYPPTGQAPDGRYQSATLAQDAVTLMDEFGRGTDSVMIGHDWGAVAASEAAVLAPDRISKPCTGRDAVAHRVLRRRPPRGPRSAWRTPV
jgi:pimeloyl-ACP methyl ester carboxylesterase